MLSDILLVGSGKFLSIRTKRITVSRRSDSGTTVSPVEQEKRIDKRRRAILPRRDICRSNGPTWGTVVSREYSTEISRDDRLSFRSEQLHQPRPHVERIDDSLGTRDLSLDSFSRLEITFSENKPLNYLFGTI